MDFLLDNIVESHVDTNIELTLPLLETMFTYKDELLASCDTVVLKPFDVRRFKGNFNKYLDSIGLQIELHPLVSLCNGFVNNNDFSKPINLLDSKTFNLSGLSYSKEANDMRISILMPDEVVMLDVMNRAYTDLLSKKEWGIV